MCGRGGQRRCSGVRLLRPAARDHYGRVAVYCDRDGRNELRPSHGDRPPRTAVSATGEIRWDATQSGKEWYAVDTPRTKFLSMFGPAGTAHVFADGFTVTLGDTLMGWAAISFTELSPGKRLLAATGYQQSRRTSG